MSRLSFSTYFFSFTVSFFFIHSFTLGQNSVGIGTEDPNENAVLQLVAPNNDQGFLVPKITTAQRTATAFTDRLGSGENGLLVFDSDENQFYYWEDSQWLELSSGLILTAGSGIDISGNVISNTGDSDNDPQNELQDLQLAGNILSVTNNGSATPIDLSGLSGALQTLSVQKTGSNVDLDISDGNTVVVNVDDADADPANEIQDISLTGADLSITSGSTVDLSVFLNTDNQVAGAVPVTPAGNLISTDVQASLEELQSDIDADGDTDPTNEFLTGGTLNVTDLEIADGGGTTVIDLSSLVDDADADPTNEIQDISISGNIVSISNGGTGFNLSPVAPTPGYVLKWNGTQWQADSDATAAGSTLPLLGNAEIVTNNGSNVAVSISGDLNMNNTGVMTILPDAVTSAEILDGTLVDTDISGVADITATKLESLVMVEGEDLSLLNNDAGFLTIVNDGDITSLDPSKLTQAGATNGQALKWNGASWAAGNDLVDDADPDPTNEYITGGNLNITDLEITDGGGTTVVDLSTLVDDADPDPTNEFQDLTFGADILGMTNSLGTVDLSIYLDNTDNQNASAVPVTPSGNLLSTDTQAALEELQGDIDLDLDADATNELNLGGSLEANNLLRIVDNGGNTDIDISRLTGNLDANSNLINNLSDPVAAQDAATMNYVDNQLTTNAWGTGGNSGTSPASNYVGTSDPQDLVLATNGTSKMRIFDADGSVSIGTLDAGLNPGFGPNDRFLTISSAEFPGTTGVSSIELSGYSSNIFDEIGRLDFDTRVSGVSNLIARVSASRVGAANAGELRLGTHNGTAFTNHVIIDENGNVGVGSANPLAKLDITGTVRTTGFQLTTTPTNGYVLTSNASGTGSWQPVPTAFSTANVIPKGNGTGLSNSIIYDDGSGHVGINEATPTAALHVSQNDGVLFGGTFNSGSLPATGNGVRMMWYPRKGALRAGRASGTDWDDVNIGDYSVSLGFSGIASGEGSASIGYGNDVTGDRSAAYGNANTVSNQRSYAVGWFNDVSGQSSASFGISNTNSADSTFTIGSWLEATNIASYVIGKGVNPLNPLVNNNPNSLMVGFYSTVPTLYVGPGFGIGSIGNVGIGTSSPVQRLDVNGTIRSTGFQLTSAPSANYVLTSNATGFGSWQPIPSPFSTANYIPKGDGSTMVQSDIYNNAGLVGIGTASPLGTLDVRGNQLLGTGITPAAVTSDNILNLQVGTNADGATNGIAFFENNTIGFGMKLGYNGVGGGADNKLSIYDNNDAEVIVFENGGNIGLGVANPVEKLEVNGNIVGESLRDYTSPSNNYISWDPSGDLRMVGGLTNTYFYGQTDGKVRIGTQFNSGSSRLLVQGFGTGTGQGLLVRSSLGTDNFVVLDNGRVGIRRNPTTYNLEVQGNAGKTTGGVDWVTISDKRLKKNIEGFSDGLDEILQINPVRFQYNELAPSPDKETEYVGVLAQDVQDILPYMVQETNDIVKDEKGNEFKVLNYDNSAMTFILINAVKELNEENQQLRERIEKQDKEISMIYSILDQIQNSLVVKTSVNKNAGNARNEGNNKSK